MKKQFELRHFQIVDHIGPVDACAQFMFKNHLISMSTIGLSLGACQTKVEVFTAPDFINTINDTGFDTVEEAIEFVIAKTKQ